MSVPFPDIVYPSARTLFGTKQLNWETGAMCVALLNGNYTAALTDSTMANIPTSAVIIRDTPLTSLAIGPLGQAQGVLAEYDALLSDSPCVGILIYQLGASDALSPLIYYSSSGIGFPFLPQGLNYFVGYDQTNGGWFQI